jgi:hypothetical protein
MATWAEPDRRRLVREVAVSGDAYASFLSVSSRSLTARAGPLEPDDVSLAAAGGVGIGDDAGEAGALQGAR